MKKLSHPVDGPRRRLPGRRRLRVYRGVDANPVEDGWVAQNITTPEDASIPNTLVDDVATPFDGGDHRPPCPRVHRWAHLLRDGPFRHTGRRSRRHLDDDEPSSASTGGPSRTTSHHGVPGLRAPHEPVQLGDRVRGLDPGRRHWRPALRPRHRCRGMGVALAGPPSPASASGSTLSQGRCSLSFTGTTAPGRRAGRRSRMTFASADAGVPHSLMARSSYVVASTLPTAPGPPFGGRWPRLPSTVPRSRLLPPREAPLEAVSPSLPTPAVDESERLAYRERLRHAIAAHPRRPRSTPVVRRAPGALLVAASTDARCLVVGCRGRGGFAGLLVGSVVDFCLRYATDPSPSCPPTTPAGATAGGGVDGSEVPTPPCDSQRKRPPSTIPPSPSTSGAGSPSLGLSTRLRPGGGPPPRGACRRPRHW